MKNSKRLKSKKRLVIRIVTSKGRLFLDLQLPRLLAALFLIFVLGVVGLASVTVYNLVIDPDSSGGNNGYGGLLQGDRVAFKNSNQVREAELQRLIDRDGFRITDLQKENQNRENEIARSEVQLVELGKTLTTLKTNLSPQLPAIGKISPPTITNKPGATPKGTSASSISNNPLASYYSDLQNLENQLASLNQLVAEKRAGLDQLQNSFNDYNAELVRLTGKEPPLPGPITNLRDAQALRPPNALPGDGPLTSSFGWRDSPFHPGTRGWHDGIDIACNLGTPVRATKAGIITFASMDQNGYGLRVDISHENGWLTFYGHNSQILVKVGQYVNQGDILSLCGSTGASTGPHIHFGLHFNGVMTDPQRYITTSIKKP